MIDFFQTVSLSFTGKPISRKLRLFSMFSDHFIMCMICTLPAIFLFPVEAKWSFYFIMIPYLNKDFLLGRSPAKRMLGIQLQDATGAPANELRAFLRNVTAVVWPVEVLVIIAGSRRKRIGDYLAGTQVVVSTTITGTYSWRQDLKTYRITSCTIYALLATLLYLLLLDRLFIWIGI